MTTPIGGKKVNFVNCEFFTWTSLHTMIFKQWPIKVLEQELSEQDIEALENGKTPLITACEVGYEEAAQLLIDKGADVNALLAQGEEPHYITPLYVAIKQRHFFLIPVLLNAGAKLSKEELDLLVAQPGNILGIGAVIQHQNTILKTALFESQIESMTLGSFTFILDALDLGCTVREALLNTKFYDQRDSLDALCTLMALHISQAPLDFLKECIADYSQSEDLDRIVDIGNLAWTIHVGLMKIRPLYALMTNNLSRTTCFILENGRLTEAYACLARSCMKKIYWLNNPTSDSFESKELNQRFGEVLHLMEPAVKKEPE